MSGKGDAPDSGKHNRYPIIAGVVAASLTLIAAIIGLVTVLVSEGDNSARSATAPPITEAGEPGSSEKTQGPNGASGEGPLDPARDGNSRATAKRLPANRPVYSSIAAGNDEDWYVYEATKDENATVEVATAGAETAGRILYAQVSEGLEEIDSSADVDDDTEPLVVPWSVKAGTRVFVLVTDICPDLGGCSIGPYKVVVRTSASG